MPITKLHIANFKGIADRQDIDIRPITIFVGPNSSGKSSCIHALATLSQTVKLPNNAKPLALDDEFASVHLGRFIEVIHSKSYQDTLTLGVSIPEVKHIPAKEADAHKRPEPILSDGSCVLTFKSTLRTQNIRIEKGTLTLGALSYTLRQVGEHFEILNTGTNHKAKFELLAPYLFQSSVQPSREAWESMRPILALCRSITSELGRTLYLGPFRQPPVRRYPTRGSNPVEVGSQGEATATLLANETVQTRKRKHIGQIASWLKLMGLATNLDVSRLGRTDMFDINLTLHDGKEFPIADLGYGLSQVLPVLTQCSFSPSRATLLFEQPELHLHSIAVKGLASIFIQTVKEKKAHIVFETHSKELVGQFLREIGDGNIAREDVALYSVRRENGKTSLSRPKIESDGEVYERWEKGLTI